MRMWKSGDWKESTAFVVVAVVVLVVGAVVIVSVCVLVVVTVVVIVSVALVVAVFSGGGVDIAGAVIKDAGALLYLLEV